MPLVAPGVSPNSFFPNSSFPFTTMAQRKSSKTNPIQPVALTVAALKAVRSCSDYNRLSSTTEPAVFEAAWNQLPESEQQRITDIVNSNTAPTPEVIATELSACGTLIQLQAVKAEHGDAVRIAWKLLSVTERDRLTAICKNGTQLEPQAEPVTEKPEAYQVEPSQEQPKRTLFSISSDLEKLNQLLDETADDAQQQELVNQWFEQLGEERDRKLDNYSALVSEMIYRVAARKAEAQRLLELAQMDENRAKLLKERLKWFFETHNLKTVETARYKLSLAKNGGKQPLILKDGVSPTQLPEQFQKVSIDPNTAAIREALEHGEKLDFAVLGDRGTSIRIK